MNKYLKWVKSDPKESVLRHAKYMAAYREWIKITNKNPDKKRLRIKADLEAAQDVVQTQQSGERLIKPKQQFVELEIYKADHPDSN